MKKVIAIILSGVFVLGAAAAIYFFIFAKSPEKVVAAAREKIEELKTVHFKMDEKITADGESVTINSEGDIIVPDKFKMKADVSGGIGQKFSFEEILVDNELFIKMSLFQNGWFKVPMDFGDIPAEGLDSGMQPGDTLEFLNASGEVKNLGDGEVNGKSCYHYSVEINDEKLASLIAEEADDPLMEKMAKEMYKDAEIEFEVWLGKDDSLPYKQKIKMETKNPKMILDATIEFSDFNKDVKIKAPEDAQEFNLDKMKEDVLKSFEGIEIPDDAGDIKPPEGAPGVSIP